MGRSLVPNPSRSTNRLRCPYELRKRVAALTGHVRPIADGTLYPAIKRLERDGLLERDLQPGAQAAPRHVLTLTDAGRAELRRRLAEPDEPFITDENRWFTMLAFLRHLDGPALQAGVLRRRWHSWAPG